MSSEAEIIIAFLFKRSGKDMLKESEIYLPLSLELGWFSTKESIDFVKKAVQNKLLKEKNGFLTPDFDVEKIAVPVGFYPSKKPFEEKKEEKRDSVVDAIVQSIVDKTNQNHKDVLERVKEIEFEKNVIVEVAALLYAKECNVDVKDYFETVEKKILEGSRRSI